MSVFVSSQGRWTTNTSMDHMLPSPGFSIPSIGTPLQHSQEEEMILPAAQQQQQQQSAQQHSQQQQQQQQGQQMGQQPQTFGSGFTPHTLMQPQTPVSLGVISYIYIDIYFENHHCYIRSF